MCTNRPAPLVAVRATPGSIAGLRVERNGGAGAARDGWRTRWRPTHEDYLHLIRSSRALELDWRRPLVSRA